MFSGHEVDRYEGPLHQVCKDVAAMVIITQGRGGGEARRMGN
jgi:hypothetical protein